MNQLKHITTYNKYDKLVIALTHWIQLLSINRNEIK